MKMILTLTNRKTNTLKCLLLMGMLYLIALIVPINPFPQIPSPIGKKLPGQPPINKPLESPTIINITNVINES